MDANSLEERLIIYAVLILEIAGFLPNSFEGRHLASQLIKSGTSTALNYGEAQAAESKKDFLHKIRIILKELKETHICLRIIKLRNKIGDSVILEKGISETYELVLIFSSISKTTEKNLHAKSKL